MLLILTCLLGETLKLKRESNLFTTKSNLHKVCACVYISLLEFCKEIKKLLEFFLHSSLKRIVAIGVYPYTSSSSATIGMERKPKGYSK
jgi:hypothetical protein